MSGMKNNVPVFSGILFPRRMKFQNSYSYADQVAMEERICEGSLRRFGWWTMELGKDSPGYAIYKEYLDAKCYQGELKFGKIRASGEGGKKHASGEGSKRTK